MEQSEPQLEHCLTAPLGSDAPAAAWRAVRVKPQHERTIAYALQRKGIEGYIPFYRTVRRWAEGVKELALPVFPGFVFCRISAGQEQEVLSVPAVYQMVGGGRGSAVRIEEAELHIIRRIESSGLPISPWPYLKDGERVRIAAGPLAGVAGLAASTSQSWHVVVNVPLLQRAVAVAVEKQQLALATAAGA